MLSNPSSSLTAAQETLSQFSDISYYKMNAFKCHILDLQMHGVQRNCLQLTYFYVWDDVGITYLEFTLTKSTSRLFKENYIPCSKLIHELDQLVSYELSWAGHLVAFKMKLLPQLLYLFCTLPIHHPISYLSSLQKNLNSFFWQGKNP